MDYILGRRTGIDKYICELGTPQPFQLFHGALEQAHLRIFRQFCAPALQVRPDCAPKILLKSALLCSLGTGMCPIHQPVTTFTHDVIEGVDCERFVPPFHGHRFSFPGVQGERIEALPTTHQEMKYAPFRSCQAGSAFA